MPELPEVETIVNDLRQRLVGRRFTNVAVCWAGSIAEPHLDKFRRRIRGQRILDVRRRGKYLIFSLLGDDSFVVHLKMTGQLLLRPATAERDKYARLVFDLDDGKQLRFVDMRKFGRVYLVDDPEAIVGELGPEPLTEDFTPEALMRMLRRRWGRIKPLLLNQRFIAGIGNIYADEILFAARIHPTRSADTLTSAEIEGLYRAIRDVLRQGIQNRGTTLDDKAYRDAEGRAGGNQDNLRVFRRAGQPCPRCGGTIQRIVVGGRGTYFCPRCQE